MPRWQLVSLAEPDRRQTTPLAPSASGSCQAAERHSIPRPGLPEQAGDGPHRRTRRPSPTRCAGASSSRGGPPSSPRLDIYSAFSISLLIRKTCPSGWRICISRTFHGSFVGGMVTSIPSSRQCRWTASTSSTQIDIQTPLSPASPWPFVVGSATLRPPPCAPWHRKISHSPEQTDPNVGGLLQSKPFFQPSFSNQAKLSTMSETFRIGVTAFASMAVLLRIGAAAYRTRHGARTIPRRSFVARRPVHPGNRDVVESEVDEQMGAVMDQVVEDHRADHGGAWQGEDQLAGLLQRPGAAHVRVLDLGERLARGRDVAVEELEDLPPAA